MRRRHLDEQLTFRDLYTLRPFRIFWITIFNLLCIFFIDFRTLIPLPVLWTVLIASMIITFQLCWRKWKKSRSDSWYHCICTGPGLIHLLLIFNFTFSFNAHDETYKFHQGTEYISRRGGRSGGTVSSTFIYLEGDAYNAYSGILVFFDQSQIKGDRITYTFATGVFGIPVMKDYKMVYGE